MNFNIRKIFFLFLSLLVIIACLPAKESRGNVIDFPYKAKQPLKFSMMFNDNSGYPYKDTWTVFKEIQKATNVELDVMVIPMSDYSNKRNLLVSSGDAPYIIPKTYPGQELQFISSGQILPISDYINDMPNFKATIKAWKLESDLKTITQRDGKFYIMPGLHEMFATAEYSLCIRADILKKNNIPMPESWDDIEKVLLKLKKIYPNIIPFSDRWQLGSTVNVAGPAFGLAEGTGIKTPQANWNNNNAVYYDPKADKFFFYPTMKEYHDLLRYFAKLTKEGLLDQESASQSDDQAVTKFVNGKSFMISCNGQAVNEYRTKMDDALGKGKYEIVRLNVPAGPGGKRIAGSRLENGVMIAAKAKNDPNFKEFLKFIDWLWYSYSALEQNKWGIEGQTYTFSKGVYAPMPGYALPSYGIGSATDTDLRKTYGYACGNFILSYGGPKQLQVSLMTPETRQWIETLNKTRSVIPPHPVIYYTDEQIESQNMIQQPLMDYVFQMTYKFILGQADVEKDWDSFVKQCKSKGSDNFINTANSVYKSSNK
jgi:putative aldouronate transport system substrate-binding protein